MASRPAEGQAPGLLWTAAAMLTSAGLMLLTALTSEAQWWAGLALVPLLVAMETGSPARRWGLAAVAFTVVHAVFLYGIVQVRELSHPVLIAGVLTGTLATGLVVMLPVKVFARHAATTFTLTLLAWQAITNRADLLGAFADPVNIGYLISTLPLPGPVNLTVAAAVVGAVNLTVTALAQGQLRSAGRRAVVSAALVALPGLLPSPASRGATTAVSVQIIEPNIPHAERELAYTDPAIRDRHERLVTELLSRPSTADFTVIGEASLPGIVDLQDAPRLQAVRPTFTGAVVRTQDRTYSAAVRLNEGYDLIRTKQSLIPLVETRWLSVRPLPSTTTVNRAGKRPVRLAFLICKDALYADQVAALTPGTADLFVVLTNSDEPLGADLQLNVVRYRAREARRPFILVNQSGGSAVIDAHGRTLTRTPWHQASATTVTVPDQTDPTRRPL